MKVFITTMEDPIFTNPFIQRILEAKKKDIVGIAVSKGGRFKARGRYFNLPYALTLSLIMGMKNTVRIGIKLVNFKTKLILSKYSRVPSPSILQTATDMGIPAWRVQSVNDTDFLNVLKDIKPDIIINQSQEILGSEFLKIPPKGVLNRHASLLPKNRGRLTPFWVLFHDERETGVSIHFVTPEIDQGAIIVQEKIVVAEDDNFISLAEKGYDLAVDLMTGALNAIERGNYPLIPNDSEKATYHSIPTLREALLYKKRQILKRRG